MEDAEKEQLVKWANETPPANVPKDYRERFSKIVEKTVLLNPLPSASQPTKWGAWTPLTDEDFEFLNHLQKLMEVQTYVERSFPGKTMRHYVDGPSGDDCFRVEGDGPSLRVTEEFLAGDGRTAEQIREDLARRPVANMMRDAGKANRLVLTRSGNEEPFLHVEPLVRSRVIPPSQGR